jgi:hypothetical protein
MKTGFRMLPAGIEEAQFKRVPEGWLFATPNPWIVGPRRTYLVNDAQKPAIAARVRRARYVRLISIVPMMMLMAAAFIMNPTLLNSPSVNTAIVFGAFIVFFTIAITAADHRCVRSLLRDIPRTSQKITLAEMLRNQTHAMSVKALSIFTLIFILAAAAQTFQLLAPGGNVFTAIGAVSLALFAIASSAMLFIKLRKRDRAEIDPELPTESLASRLDRVERLNRRLGWSLAAVGILAVSAPLAILAVLQLNVLRLNAQSVTAKSFVVRNATGNMVATLFAGPGGMPSLILFDAKQNRRINIALTEDGSPYVSLTDAQVRLRALLDLNKDQEPNLLFLDPQAKVRTSIGLRGNLPSLWLADAQGALRAMLSLDNKQQPALRFADAQKKWRATVGLDNNSSPMLKLYGSDGAVQWDAPTAAVKKPTGAGLSE